MTPQEYADRIAALIREVEHRVVNVGASQYGSSDPQRFESRKLADIIQDAREEVQDAVAYLTAMDIRLQRITEILPEEGTE